MALFCSGMGTHYLFVLPKRFRAQDHPGVSHREIFAIVAIVETLRHQPVAAYWD